MMSTTAKPVFPPEIWLLIVQELTIQKDYSSLFMLGQTEKGISKIALQLLYGIDSLAPCLLPSANPVDSKAICFWHTLLSSCLGQTFYPYHSWITTIVLQPLQRLIIGLTQEDCDDGDVIPTLRARFFGPPLERLDASRQTNLGYEKIVDDAITIITSGMRGSSGPEGATPAVWYLYGSHSASPPVTLPTLLSSLPRLTYVGMVGQWASDEFAHILCECCPGLKKLDIGYHRGTPCNDEKLASFMKALKPNTLESFRLFLDDGNNIGRESFKALALHAQSLKELKLSDIEQTGLLALNELRECVALETLLISATRNCALTTSDSWKNDNEQVFNEVVRWLQRCISLKRLHLEYFPGSPLLIMEVLSGARFRLKSLTVSWRKSSQPELYASLARQPDLQEVIIRSHPPLDNLPVNDASCAALVGAIRKWSNLHELDIDEPLTLGTIEQICKTGRVLEHFCFTSPKIDDSFLQPLATLPQLKRLLIRGPSVLTPEGLLQFAQRLDEQPHGSHKRLFITLEQQLHKFSEQAKKEVSKAFKDRFRGYFEEFQNVLERWQSLHR